MRGAGRAFCAGYDFGDGLSAGRRTHHRRGVGPRQGLRRGHGAGGRADAEVHERLALAQAGDRAGPRLVRRRRQRLRAVLRPRGRQRGRGDRHALQPHVGRVPVGHVALPARAGPREVARADRAAADRAARPPTSSSSTRRCRSPSSRPRWRRWPRTSPRIPLSQLSAMKLVVNHAYENMGLASTQTLGPILDGLMRNTPDALALHRQGRDRGRARRRDRARRPVRRLQPGAARAPAGPGQRDHAVRTTKGAVARALRTVLSRPVGVWRSLRDQLEEHLVVRERAAEGLLHLPVDLADAALGDAQDVADLAPA